MSKFNRYLIAVLLVIFAAVAVVGCSTTTTDNENKNGEAAVSESQESLMVYSGAGLRKPMDEIGKVFEEKYNVKVEYSYAGSAQNLSQIEITGKGDVYIPGAMYYAEQAIEKGLAINKQDVAYHIPVIAVPKGNPAGIKKLEDLAKPGVKVALGDEKAAAIGKTAISILEKNGIKSAVEANVKATAPTVNEVLVYVTMKQVDAAIIWEDNVVGVEEVEIVQIPAEQNEIKTLPVCVLKSSEKPDLAQKFADFVAGPEGKEIFEKHGFRPVE
ncbi:MAG: molybdate ABC transporter substrate-binding protein [Syntrophomonadaceae bacterium]|nr:molybdate ABC transporter substrate-binding protein [Syntrophomonadaceae bacterium]